MSLKFTYHHLAVKFTSYPFLQFMKIVICAYSYRQLVGHSVLVTEANFNTLQALDIRHWEGQRRRATKLLKN